MSYEVATEMVREAFVDKYGYSPELFDNWLKFIVDEERERVIALLETKSSEFAESHDWADVELLTYVISLIKGDVAERRQTRMPEYGDKGENE